MAEAFTSRYFRKDAAVEAWQWLGLGSVPGVYDWELGRGDEDDRLLGKLHEAEYGARLPDGKVVFPRRGDWVVKHPDGRCEMKTRLAFALEYESA